MELLPPTQNLHQILTQDIPIIDVRAPIEFAQGALPSAINLPLMSNEERAAVGTCYKQQGSQQAVSLGHKLVSGDTRTKRLNDWQTACRLFPNGYLCCARGGMRSHIVQEWLKDIGIEYPLIIGGYKALRKTTIESINQLVKREIILIGGCTGNGKTIMVRGRSDGIDLEGIARHRGSSFGRTLENQLSQATFENHLAIKMLKKSPQHTRWILEDEGKAIGANSIPENLRLQMAQAPLVIVDDPFDYRLERLKEEYFDRMTNDFLAAYGEEQGWLAYSEYLHHGLSAIRKRLGSQRTTELIQLLDLALNEQKKGASTEVHFSWLTPLLKEYYDPMYNYQLSKKQERILFRGRYHEVINWLDNH